MQSYNNIVRTITPEEQELEKKRLELALLITELTQSELELETLKGHLRNFER